jgi:hypothetical protein
LVLITRILGIVAEACARDVLEYLRRAARRRIGSRPRKPSRPSARSPDSGARAVCPAVAAPRAPLLHEQDQEENDDR